MAAGIAGFVDGVFKGMDWREGRDDRKRRRKMEDEEFGWRREDQEWQREDRQYTRSERARARSEREAEQAAWNQTADEMFGGSEDTAPPAGEPRQSASDVLITQGGLGFSLPRDNAPAKEAPVTKSTKDEAPATRRETAPPPRPEASLGKTGSGVGGARPEVIGGGMPAAEGTLDLRSIVESMGSDAVGYNQGQVDPRLAGASGLEGPAPAGPGTPPTPAMAGPVAVRPGTEGGMPAARPDEPPRGMSILELAAEQSMPQAARDRFNRAETPAPEAAALRPMVPVQRTDAASIAQRRASEAAQPNLPPAPAPRPGPRQGPPMAADGPQDPPRAEDASLPPSRPAKPAATNKPAPPPAPPATEAGTPMESVSTLVETGEKLSFGIVGDNGAVKSSPASVDRAVNAGAKAYTKDKVPAIVEHYIRTGQIEKAKAFEQWIEDRGVQQGMRSWMKAIHSFQVGDGQGFLEGMADAYEADNYYDDGLSIVREGSSLEYDDAGNIVGAKITFRDEASGRTFTQNVSDVRDLVASAIGIMAPEKAFELAWDQTFGKDKAAEKPDRVTRAEAIKMVNDEAAERAKVLGGTPMTEQEKQARFEAIMGGENPYQPGAASGVGSQIPVYR